MSFTRAVLDFQLVTQSLEMLMVIQPILGQVSVLQDRCDQRYRIQNWLLGAVTIDSEFDW